MIETSMQHNRGMVGKHDRGKMQHDRGKPCHYYMTIRRCVACHASPCIVVTGLAPVMLAHHTTPAMLAHHVTSPTLAHHTTPTTLADHVTSPHLLTMPLSQRDREGIIMDLLDLCITLVPPPPDASPDTIASIELRCDQLGLQYRGGVLKDPLTARERENMRWYLEEYSYTPYEPFLDRAKQIEASLATIGKRLYDAVFGTEVQALVQAWRLQPDVQRQISIVCLVPAAINLPWELLHDEQGFLVLRTRNPVALIRRLEQHGLAAFPTPFEPPLRILLVTARPEGTGFIDPRDIAHELLDEMQQQINEGAIALEFLRPPTLPALRVRLADDRQPSIQILHFDGHGEVSKGKHIQGMLNFEDEEGNLDRVQAEDVAQVLSDSGVHLAVLTACQSAQGDVNDAFSSVATQMIRSGVDAVTAMSASVLVVSATRYSEAFYRSLVTGASVPVAQERARQALHDDPRRHIYGRNKNNEGTVVTLRDWWLPQYFQQRPVVLQSTKAVRRRRNIGNPVLPPLSEQMPDEPQYGFGGRARELLRIERLLLHKKIVVMHGSTGMGKTALAREAADWLTRTKMYESACYVSFEHGGDVPALLDALGQYLAVQAYDPHDTKGALTKLSAMLKRKHLLLIADNLESILPSSATPLESAKRTALYNVLLELAKTGMGMILISQDIAFGDGRLAPGVRVAHLPLQGLRPDDAYALATRILTALNRDRSLISYKELRELLAQLDYVPVAIQQVLPTHI